MSARALIAVAAVALLGGCGPDVCGAYGGKSCIELEVRGPAATQIDELRLHATAGFTLDATTARPDHAPQTPPIWVAVLPGDAFAGGFSLDVSALLGAVELGHAGVDGVVERPGQHVHVVAELAGPLLEADLSTTSDGGADLASPVDGLGDGPSPDLRPPLPADSECASVSDSWVKASKATSSCAARVVAELGTDPANVTRVGIDRLAIARAPTGRVGVVYGGYGPDGPDERPLVISTFTGDTFPPTVTSVGYGGTVLGDRPGTSPSIAAAADGTFDLCYLDTSDSGNEVHYTVFDTNGAFGAPETVATGQGSDGHVATAIDGLGHVICAYYNQANGNVYSKRRISGVWDATAANVRSGNASTLPGRGAVSLAVSSGDVFLAHHYALTNTGAQPMYASFDGGNWSSPKTVDNAANGTTANFGQSVDLDVFGTRAAVAYLVPGASTWGLRVATFDSASAAPGYDDVRADAGDTVTSTHAAIAYDPWGQLHIALISPTGTTASLLYLRQYPDGTGGTRWLVDLVDAQAGDGTDTSSVDLTVDSRGRPHIAYYSGETGKLMYATRTDRN